MIAGAELTVSSVTSKKRVAARAVKRKLPSPRGCSVIAAGGGLSRKTAKMFRFAIPQELLLRADRVIE